MNKRIFAAMTLLTMGLSTAQTPDNTLSEAEKAEGYKLLFDGSTFKSWNDNWVNYIGGAQRDSTNTTLSSEWKVNTTEHTINLPKGSIPEDARSVKKYKDFELRWWYKTSGNQGVFYRSLLTYDRAWYTGVEYAINDLTNLGKDNPGAAYDLYAPPDPVPYHTYNNGTGLWNTARIVCKGDSVEHWMNEKKVVGFRYHSPSFWATYNTSKWVTTGNRSLTNVVPGTQEVGKGYITEGYLGIQADHGGKWSIKNMKLTENPCFGPIKADGSVCASTPIVMHRMKMTPVPYVAARQGLGAVHVTFTNDAIKGATLVGVDGKIKGIGTVMEAGHKAEFKGSFKTGLYFLRLETASGVVTEKMNLL